MCGIAGVLFFERGRTRSEDVEALVRQMGRQLARRGPDDERIYVDDWLVLLFRRLSINDLAHGSQPFVDDDSGLVSATNGEIYNHREIRGALSDVAFATRCDTEVINPLAARFGADFPTQLRGMFGSAVWNRRTNELMLARDRFGIKPMYFIRHDKYVLFASELKALLCHPATAGSLTEYFPPLVGLGSLDVPVVPPGIDEVPPAHTVVFSVTGSVRRHRYWDIRHSLAKATHRPFDPNDAVREYANLVSESVQEELLSDVPLGVFLSGGIDSSLVTAEVARRTDNVHAFSVLHESTLSCGDAATAELVAKATGAHLHFVDFRGEDLPNRLGMDLRLFEYFVWVAERPWLSLEDFFKHELHRLAKHVVPGIKVVLLGQGADEFAGGYSNQKGLDVSNQDWDAFLQSTPGSWRGHPVARFFRPELTEMLLGQSWGEWGREAIRHAEQTLSSGNLRTEDRVSSAQGMEARVPFLDHRIVEFLSGLPPALHAHLFWDKKIVREALAMRVPSYPKHHRKHPFVFAGTLDAAGNHLWGLLRAAFPEFRESYLTDPRSPFDAASVVGLFEKLDNAAVKDFGQIELLQGLMSSAVWDRWLRRLKTERPAFHEYPLLSEFSGVLTSPEPQG